MGGLASTALVQQPGYLDLVVRRADARLAACCCAYDLVDYLYSPAGAEAHSEPLPKVGKALIPTLKIADRQWLSGSGLIRRKTT